MVGTIAANTTRTGLTVCAELDPGRYDTGIKISDAQMNALPLTRHHWHGDWNYTLHPAPFPPPPGLGTAEWAHPALTGLDPAQWDQLITRLYHRLGGPPPGRQPALSLAGQTLITVLSLRFRPHAATLAQLFAVPASTIQAAQRRIWPLLVQAGYPTELAGPQLKTPADLTAYARAHGIELTTTHPS